MNDVVLYGFPQSTYVRTARLVLEEKGVAYELSDLEFASDAHRALHPFVKVPILHHGPVTLWETSAISHYVDEAFAGPQLRPADAVGRAQVEQWISAVLDYIYDGMARTVVYQRLAVPSRGGEPDEVLIRETLPEVERQLDLVEGRLAAAEFMVGDDLSLADLFLLPILFYLGLTPEGGRLLASRPGCSAWFERLAARPSFAATLPPAPAEAAE